MACVRAQGRTAEGMCMIQTRGVGPGQAGGIQDEDLSEGRWPLGPTSAHSSLQVPSQGPLPKGPFELWAGVNRGFTA